MSLYNMLFGVEPTAVIALKMLGIGTANVPRFRDAFFTWADEEQTVPCIVIHTRTGGGNRGFYDSEERCRAEYPEDFHGDTDDPSGPWNADLRKLPGYQYDQDDSFDATYADFYFRVPEDELRAVIDHLKASGAPLTPHDKFERLMAALSNK